MATKINILNASERFSHVLDLLENKAQDSLVEIKKHIELPNIDIVISPCSEEYKAESGILGCVSTPYVIDVLLDTDRKDLSNIINNELTSVIAHELHHVIRASFGVQEKSLLQVLVSEGLACHFETKFSDDATSKFFADIKNMNGVIYIAKCKLIWKVLILITLCISVVKIWLNFQIERATGLALI